MESNSEISIRSAIGMFSIKRRSPTVIDCSDERVSPLRSVMSAIILYVKVASPDPSKGGEFLDLLARLARKEISNFPSASVIVSPWVISSDGSFCGKVPRFHQGQYG